MAGFKTHVTTSTVLGIGYAGGSMLLGAPIDASLVAGGLCGLAGMGPDLDSDSGIPMREAMAFSAAIVPMLLVDRFQQFGLSHEQMVLATGSLYLLIRFLFAEMLKKYTVHRGMFHSIPAALLFSMAAFLICGSEHLELRYLKAGGVFLGVMSHLVLDELWSIEMHRGRMRFKKSFGTAMKFWGDSLWGNVSCYGKLIVAVSLILSEPMIVERYGAHHPDARQIAEEFSLDSATDNAKKAPKTIYETAHRIIEKFK
ncbi:MAG: metal-dependent hydrolase [Planctomycetales bacterium]|nr:metal-dependent hydrolase [Planctomycetales bacterium]